MEEAMKKLLILLILTLGISQTKLETRVYDVSISMVEQESQNFNLSELTNGELGNSQNAILDIFNVSNISVNNNSNSVLYIKYDFNDFQFVTIYDSDINWYRAHTSLSYIADMQHQWHCSTGNLEATLAIAVTAEFPEEETGYLDEEFDFCLSPGANLVSYPCDNPVPVGQALPGGAENFISSIIGQGQATQYNSSAGWVGSLSSFNAGSGYWFIANSDVCFQYECVAN